MTQLSGLLNWFASLISVLLIALVTSCRRTKTVSTSLHSPHAKRTLTADLANTSVCPASRPPVILQHNPAVLRIVESGLL